MNGPTDSRRLKLAGVAILALDVCFGVVLLDRVGDDTLVRFLLLPWLVFLVVAIPVAWLWPTVAGGTLLLLSCILVGFVVSVPDSWTAGQVSAVVVVGAPGVAGLLTSAARYVPLFRRGPPGIGD